MFLPSLCGPLRTASEIAKIPCSSSGPLIPRHPSFPPFNSLPVVLRGHAHSEEASGMGVWLTSPSLKHGAGWEIKIGEAEAGGSHGQC